MSLEYREETEPAVSPGPGQQSEEVLVYPIYSVALLIGIAAVFLVQVYVGLQNDQAYAAAFDKPVFRD